MAMARRCAVAISKYVNHLFILIAHVELEYRVSYLQDALGTGQVNDCS